MAALYETSVRVVVEFQRSSETGVGRVIRFNHSPQVLPTQLKGRISQETWASFMSDIDVLAKDHPYVQKPELKHYGAWGACFALGSVIGVCCVNPDAGNYDDWEQEAHQVIQRHQKKMKLGGCQLSLQKGRDYWVQIDIDPSAPFVEVDGQEPPTSNDASTRSYLSPFQSAQDLNV